MEDFVMPAGRNKVVVFDEEQTGFAVNITHRGTMSYVMVYRDATGAQRQEKLARVGDVSANAARALAKARLAEVQLSRGQSARLRRRSFPTMDAFFFDTFLPAVKNTSRSYRAHASIYQNHIQPVFGKKHLSVGVLKRLHDRWQAASGPWVFPNPTTGKPYTSCRSAWVTARNKANLEGLRMHDLRHTYALMMLDSGADIVDVQQALGHTQLKTTAVYLHLTEGRKRANANAAADATGLFK